nr:H118 [uncultured bacterium]
MDSEALQGVSECDGCATGNGAQYPNTVPQGSPGIVTVWVVFAPLRCIVWIDAIRV